MLEKYVDVLGRFPAAACRFNRAKDNLAWVHDALHWSQFDNVTQEQPVRCVGWQRGAGVAVAGRLLVTGVCNPFLEWKLTRAFTLSLTVLVALQIWPCGMVWSTCGRQVGRRVAQLRSKVGVLKGTAPCK